MNLRLGVSTAPHLFRTRTAQPAPPPAGPFRVPTDARDLMRERDSIVKMLRQRPIDPDAPPKPTVPDLMGQLVAGITDEYQQDAEGRTQLASEFFTPEERT